MNEADFWRVIGSPKRDDDGFKATGSLCVKLKALAPEEIRSFYLHILEKLSLLHTPEILGAASLVTCNKCDFLDFYFFRTWVISLGQKAYEAALLCPDGLIAAKACFSASKRGEDFDGYVSVAPLIYFLETGQSLVTQLRSENPSFSAMPEPIEDLGTVSDEELRVRYPQLWTQKTDPTYAAACVPKVIPFEVREATSPFLGTLKRGTLLTHRTYGPGYVLHVMTIGTYLEGIVLFEDSRRPMVLEDPSLWKASSAR